MGLFKSSDERRMEREMEIRKGLSRIKKQIRSMEREEQDFIKKAKRARQLGADTLVTGHYARIEERDGRLLLRRGADPQKDQSYFLFSMPVEELSSIQFPLGSYNKEETRALAEKFSLPNAQKKDSQEICFVPDGDYGAFVEKAALSRGLSLPVAGDIVTEDGSVVGRHKGVHRYTIGQRRGIGDVKLSGGGPAYVLGLDVENNRLIVGAPEKAPTVEFEVENLRWFIEKPTESFNTQVQVRHGGRTLPGRVDVMGDKARVSLQGDAVCAPGQAAVFYDGEYVQGGGWIC